MSLCLPLKKNKFSPLKIFLKSSYNFLDNLRKEAVYVDFIMNDGSFIIKV
jgi:hypothetical protein